MARSAHDQIEYQMRFNEILSKMATSAHEANLKPRSLGPFVTLSREVGAGGAEVARLVGERLGWSVLDRELVGQLAERLKLDPRLLELMDETRSGWWRDTLLNLLNSRLVLQDSYVSMLSKIVLLAAYDGKVVLVGRGANLLLPRQGGVRVRVVADEEDRVRRLAHREGLEAAEAVQRLKEQEASRADFIRRHFHRDVADAGNFDLVLSTSAFGIDGAVDLIGRAVESIGIG